MRLACDPTFGNRKVLFNGPHGIYLNDRLE
jgi:hypothetical protein